MRINVGTAWVEYEFVISGGREGVRLDGGWSVGGIGGDGIGGGEV